MSALWEILIGNPQVGWECIQRETKIPERTKNQRNDEEVRKFYMDIIIVGLKVFTTLKHVEIKQ